jgi:hypothetical protein
MERIGTDEGRPLSIGVPMGQMAGVLPPEGSSERPIERGLLQIVAMSTKELIASRRRFRALAFGRFGRTG